MRTAFAIVAAFVMGQVHGQMPDKVRLAIDDHLVGAWSSVQTFDGKVSKGEVVNRWSEGGTTVLGRASYKGPDGQVEINSIIGWQPDSKSVVEHGYSSDDSYWMIRWTNLGDDQWEGKGTGQYQGKPWKSDTTIKFGKDSARYEDVTDGKPFVVEFRKKTSDDAEKAFSEFAKFMSHGAWVNTGGDAGVKVDRHVWSDSKKFVRIESFGGEVFSATYGVDPITKNFTIWYCEIDGSIGYSVCTDYQDGQGTWEGEKIDPSGKREKLKSRMTIVNENELRFTTLDGKDTIDIWTRR